MLEIEILSHNNLLIAIKETSYKEKNVKEYH